MDVGRVPAWTVAETYADDLHSPHFDPTVDRGAVQRATERLHYEEKMHLGRADSFGPVPEPIRAIRRLLPHEAVPLTGERIGAIMAALDLPDPDGDMNDKAETIAWLVAHKDRPVILTVS